MEFLPGDWERISHNAIMSGSEIKMANLCLTASHTINGVSALHSDILKNQTFADYYKMNPTKFTNVTNGITYRRWLCEANPKLCSLVTDLIGDKFLYDAMELENLMKYQGDNKVLNQLKRLKQKTKFVLQNILKRQMA